MSGLESLILKWIGEPINDNQSHYPLQISDIHNTKAVKGLTEALTQYLRGEIVAIRESDHDGLTFKDACDIMIKKLEM